MGAYLETQCRVLLLALLKFWPMAYLGWMVRQTNDTLGPVLERPYAPLYCFYLLRRVKETISIERNDFYLWKG